MSHGFSPILSFWESWYPLFIKQRSRVPDTRPSAFHISFSGILHQLLYVRDHYYSHFTGKKTDSQESRPLLKDTECEWFKPELAFFSNLPFLRIKGLHSKHWWGRVLLKEPIIDLPRHWNFPREPRPSLQTLILFRRQYVTLVDLVGITEWCNSNRYNWWLVVATWLCFNQRDIRNLFWISRKDFSFFPDK